MPAIIAVDAVVIAEGMLLSEAHGHKGCPFMAAHVPLQPNTMAASDIRAGANPATRSGRILPVGASAATRSGRIVVTIVRTRSIGTGPRATSGSGRILPIGASATTRSGRIVVMVTRHDIVSDTEGKQREGDDEFCCYIHKLFLYLKLIFLVLNFYDDQLSENECQVVFFSSSAGQS
jgi:hypothetical protein